MLPAKQPEPEPEREREVSFQDAMAAFAKKPPGKPSLFSGAQPPESVYQFKNATKPVFCNKISLLSRGAFGAEISFETLNGTRCFGMDTGLSHDEMVRHEEESSRFLE